MANSAVSDQPTVYTLRQMKDLVGENDVYTRTRLGRSSKGARIVLPLIDPENEDAKVAYIFDGADLWHRADTKAAQVVRNTAKRQVVGRG